MVDSEMFYLIGTLYPLVARATYPALSFPQYPGEVGCSDADEANKAQARQDEAAAIAGASAATPQSAGGGAVGGPLEVYNSFFPAGPPFIGGDQPSIADIRL